MGKGKLFFFFPFSAWAAATLERYLGTSVPNKVRNFLWRACKEAIPTKESLCQGRIFLEDNCEYCDNSSEDVLHALWNCPALSPVCVGLFLNLVFFATTDISIIFWIFFLYVKEEEKDLELFSMLVWTVWYRRNLIRTQFPESSHQLPRHCRTLSWIIQDHRYSSRLHHRLVFAGNHP